MGRQAAPPNPVKHPEKNQDAGRYREANTTAGNRQAPIDGETASAWIDGLLHGKLPRADTENPPPPHSAVVTCHRCSPARHTAFSKVYENTPNWEAYTKVANPLLLAAAMAIRATCSRIYRIDNTHPCSCANEVTVLWVPAHKGMIGNEAADGMAKEAAEDRAHDVPDEICWQTSLSHLSRRVTESRARATAQWTASHVRAERRYHPPGGSGLRRRLLRRTRKSVAGRYCQLLSGHAAIGSFMHERMSGPQRVATSECWWCNSGRRQSRHHLFTECRAWAPQVRRLWKRVGKDCGWKHRRAPSVR